MVAFSPYGTLLLAVGTSSTSGPLPAGSRVVVVSSDGPAPVWLNFSKGAGVAIAGTGGSVVGTYALLPGQTVQLGCGNVDTVNAISATACNLYVTAGSGDFAGSGGGGGGGGGGTSGLSAVNLTQVGGAPIALGPVVSTQSLPMAPATDALFNMTGAVTASGTMTLGAGSANVGNVGLAAGSTVGIAAGSAVMGKVQIDQTTGGTTNAVQLVASSGAGGGVSGCSRTIISSTTATVVKATAGTVFGMLADNNTSGPVYVKLYDAASATVGQASPLPRMIFMVPGPTNGGGGYRDYTSPVGTRFTTGICMICTQLQADNDTTVVPAGSVTVTVLWV